MLSRAGEIAQRLRVLLSDLPEVLSSIPSNYMGVLQPSIMESDALFWPAGVHADRAHIHKISKSFQKDIIQNQRVFF